ncbi:hypothetical protein BS50DRAFT_630565 [Corynespora cassiicola Philippines]|uniref:Uncharacterized protein n=1 Tax=Corynespora cassiicola Philippines TaxID=1448308 RepID=A0A2T2P4H1_CORCC|nr:hypothetical protein BS50DRAFT_630565 [Corynespora cassiicola Philippines]
MEVFKLKNTAKAYGDIKSIVRATIEEGKAVFCEWPLARNTSEARDLASLAESKGVLTYVCLESRLSPPVAKIRDIISLGTIDAIRSTDILCTLGPVPTSWSSRNPAYSDVHSGQSPLNTRAGHPLDAFCHLLGEFDSFQSLLVTRRTEIKTYDASAMDIAALEKTDAAFEVAPRTAPDEILLQGRLAGGATVSFHLRSGDIDADGNNFRWLIAGENGLIEVTQKTGQFLRDKSVEIRLVKGSTSSVAFCGNDWISEGPFRVFGDNVVLTTPGLNYQAIAEGLDSATLDFRHAVKRREMIDDIISRGR